MLRGPDETAQWAAYAPTVFICPPLRPGGAVVL